MYFLPISNADSVIAMPTARPNKNNNHYIEQTLVILAVILIGTIGTFFLSKSSSKMYINNEMVHGPHVGPDLTKFIESLDADDDELANVSRSHKKIATSSVKSITATTTTTTTTTTQAPTNGSVITPTATTTTTISIAQEKGIGIAAGGGLVGYSQSALDAYFSNLKTLGITWVRWDIDWAYIQPNGPDTYDWSGTDRVANTAKNYGIKSLAIILDAPRWAGFDTCVPDRHCAPADASVFAHFASVAATRYKDKIYAWEIWNEQNLSGSWSPKPDVAAYGNVLELAYIQIKNIDPQAFIISGGLSAAADVPGGSIAPITFVTGLYNSGFNKYFDALALHPYTYPVSPDYIAPWNSWQQMYTIRDLMIGKGDSSKKIWVTEYGAPTGGPGIERSIDTEQFKYGSDYMSELAQQQMADRVTKIYSQNTSWMGPFFWYSLKDNGTDRNDPENFFGLIRYDGSHKPAYDIIKNFISGFNSSI